MSGYVLRSVVTVHRGFLLFPPLGANAWESTRDGRPQQLVDCRRNDAWPVYNPRRTRVQTRTHLPHPHSLAISFPSPSLVHWTTSTSHPPSMSSPQSPLRPFANSIRPIQLSVNRCRLGALLPTIVGSPPGKSPTSRETLEKELIFSRPGALISAWVESG
jgi:hypothetical protein